MDTATTESTAPELVLDDKTQRQFVTWFRGLPQVSTSSGHHASA